jgi:hypothetical protein
MGAAHWEEGRMAQAAAAGGDMGRGGGQQSEGDEAWTERGRSLGAPGLRGSGRGVVLAHSHNCQGGEVQLLQQHNPQRGRGSVASAGGAAKAQSLTSYAHHTRSNIEPPVSTTESVPAEMWSARQKGECHTGPTSSRPSACWLRAYAHTCRQAGRGDRADGRWNAGRMSMGTPGCHSRKAQGEALRLLLRWQIQVAMPACSRDCRSCGSQLRLWLLARTQ